MHEDADQAFEQAETALCQAPEERSQAWWVEWVNFQLDRIGFFYWSGRAQEIEHQVEKVRPAVEQYGTPLQRAKFYDGLNLMAIQKECFILSDETLQLALLSLSAGEQSGDLAEITWNNFQLGFSYLWHGDLEAAEKQLHKALSLAERIGDVTTQSRILTYLTITYRKLGDVQKVRQVAPRSLEVSTIGQMIQYTSMAQANLGWAERREGNLDQAQTLVEAAWEDFKTTITSGRQAWVVAWPLVAIYLAQGRLPEAVEFTRKLVAPIAQPQPEPIAQHLQAAIQAWEANEPEEAVNEINQAAALAEPLGYI
jgi:tetratricopeptide (TPR) repeat protein